jgi:hypothetical protein
MLSRKSRETASVFRYSKPPASSTLPSRTVFSFWNVHGIHAVKPPVRSWSSRTTSHVLHALPVRLSRRRTSSSPSSHAELVRALVTSTHFVVGALVSDQMRLRTESSRISAPPPGIDWSPASRSRATTSRIGHFVSFWRK